MLSVTRTPDPGQILEMILFKMFSVVDPRKQLPMNPPPYIHSLAAPPSR